MHTIWDSRIIESQGITLTNLQDDGIKKLGTGPVDFMVWLNQSRSLLTQVYDIKGYKLDDHYLQKNKAVVITQLKNASVLLASCFESLFSKATTIPATPPAAQPTEKTSKTLSAGTTITPDQAAAHIGETIVVCGKVYGTRLLENGPTFINMGGEYPNNPFTAVIMFNKRSNFSYKPEDYLNGKSICVTGTIKEYKGKPQIIIDKENQIRVQ